MLNDSKCHCVDCNLRLLSATTLPVFLCNTAVPLAFFREPIKSLQRELCDILKTRLRDEYVLVCMDHVS